MNLTTVEIGAQRGAIFEGELPDTYCFVPENCIHEEYGKTKIAEIDYVRSHWDERNMRANIEPEGKRLFPKSDCPVENLYSGPVQDFIDRIRNAWSGGLAAA